MPFILPQYNSNDWKVLKDLQATQYRRYDGYDATHKIAVFEIIHCYCHLFSITKLSYRHFKRLFLSCLQCPYHRAAGL